MSGTPASGETSVQPRRGIRVLVVSLSIVLFVVGSITGVWWIAKLQAARARAQWKGPALESLAKLSNTNEQISRELDQLKAPTPNINFGWADDHLLLMTNGEYI